MKKTNNKAKITVIALVLVACLGVAGMSAYFTDADTETNTFTIGKISIDLLEPNWEPPTDITPEQEIAKDPQIENNGINDEYVFLEVVVPYANVITANEDGSENPAADTELFIYNIDEENWVEIGTPTKDEDAGTVTHVYAYAKDGAMTTLTAGETTPELFTLIKFVNVVEDQGLEESIKHVVVNAYGIQTDNINDGNTDILDGANDDGVISPEEVWSVITTQAPDMPESSDNG